MRLEKEAIGGGVLRRKIVGGHSFYFYSLKKKGIIFIRKRATFVRRVSRGIKGEKKTLRV